MNNATGSVWVVITNLGVVRSQPDRLQSETRSAFVAQTPETLAWDGDGNLVRDGRWMYSWDAENRLTRVMSYGATDRGSWRRVEWKYHAMGRRVRQTSYVHTNGAWQVVEDLTFVSDPELFGRHIAELNATNNALVRAYVGGLDLSETLDGAGGVGGLLWIRVATGPAAGTHFVCYDGNGNVWNLVSATTGTETARHEYGPFGEPLRLSGPAAHQNPFRFSTKRTEDFAGLVLYEYRVYHVGIGCWVTRDLINEPGFVSSAATRLPARLEEERNLVTFVGNDPMQQVDSLGTRPCICVFKGNIGRLTVKSSCRGVLSMWVIDEYGAPAAGATAGVTVSADGFVIGGDTYKIDGSTCVEIDCDGSTVTVSCCVNLIAICLGKRCPYVVSAGTFGGPPKEPPPGAPPPVVK